MVDRARDLYTNVSCPDVQCFGSQGSADIPPALVVRRRAQALYRVGLNPLEKPDGGVVAAAQALAEEFTPVRPWKGSSVVGLTLV